MGTVEVYDLTDHLPNFVILNKFCNLPKISRYQRDYSNFDESALIDEISSTDWNIQYLNLILVLPARLTRFMISLRK